MEIRLREWIAMLQGHGRIEIGCCQCLSPPGCTYASDRRTEVQIDDVLVLTLGLDSESFLK